MSMTHGACRAELVSGGNQLFFVEDTSQKNLDSFISWFQKPGFTVISMTFIKTDMKTADVYPLNGISVSKVISSSAEMDIF